MYSNNMSHYGVAWRIIYIYLIYKYICVRPQALQTFCVVTKNELRSVLNNKFIEYTCRILYKYDEHIYTQSSIHENAIKTHTLLKQRGQIRQYKKRNKET